MPDRGSISAPVGIHVGLVVLLCLVTVSSTRSADETTEEPRESGLVEETGIDLQLLDVEVLDRHGEPVLGLTKEDFSVWIDGTKLAEIYSVDDLCPCAPSSAPTGDQRAGSRQVRRSPAESTLEQARRKESSFAAFVLYFDFSQLQVDGRQRAFGQAQRWIRNTLPAGKPAMIMAYHNNFGLREVSPLTSDKDRLVERLEQAEQDPTLIDGFPSEFATQREICQKDCNWARAAGICRRAPCNLCVPGSCSYPSDMYLRGKRSLSALGFLLASLEQISGRKALVLFTQNSAIYPGRVFPNIDPDSVMDLVAALDRVGAEANLSRTTLYSAFVGDELSESAPWRATVNVGANLAEFTGGAYNRGISTLNELTESVVERCSCIYRIAIVRPARHSSEVRRILVEAAGRRIPFRYRMEFLDDADRWWRQARGVLQNPEIADDVGVRASLTPVARDETGWTVRAEVGLDVDSLLLIPETGGQRASWEVGALFYREPGGEKWEMLGRSDVRITGNGATGADVIHERTFKKVPAGSYRIRAFVRDRTANLFGGGEGTLELPKPGEPGWVGPIVFKTDRRIVRSPLPLREKSETESPQANRLETGDVPVSRYVFSDGQPIEFRSWFCPGKDSSTPPEPVRFVADSLQPLFQFEAEEPEPAGDCFMIADLIETQPLSAGEYRYHCRWAPSGDSEVTERDLVFEIRRPEE